MERLIHKPEGKLVVEDPFLVAGTVVHHMSMAKGDNGVITEACVRQTKERLRQGNQSSVFVLYKGFGGPVATTRANNTVIND